ncbi:DM13 domain-containing protein [Paraglaciecola aquimarina]|uniref:DM13 domain-containing protein n=1 Tax=Paraglaciecola algarum TaxID=3050085 RepID=A0ABS9DCA0_9ALTE|nr:DM13 domain-containing protein [Paraglaciecola sp. G1-23]MCF2950485.1 DM13 domain-containing protein [Paraglaciecola sp. G1-23]
MTTRNSIHLSSILVCLLLVACGGSSSAPTGNTPVISPTPQTPAPALTVLSGTFIDSAVQGLNYVTATQTGTTDEEGTFLYIDGETVTFSIGDIQFPEVTAGEMLSPLDVFGVTDVNDIQVQNMARLLQSLDQDGIAGNGITISDNAHTQATGLTVDFASADFATQVEGLVANTGAVYTSLISAQSAIEHLNLSLSNEANTQNCDLNTSKAGYTGEFTNYAHDVAGKAKVLDGCTIEITMFNFDGQAPNVRFYSGNNLMFTGDNAVALSDRIDGRAYQAETIILRMPAGVSVDDFDSISVWCVEFTVDFGSLVLAGP